jgi:hypothetical protein
MMLAVATFSASCIDVFACRCVGAIVAWQSLNAPMSTFERVQEGLFAEHVHDLVEVGTLLGVRVPPALEGQLATNGSE